MFLCQSPTNFLQSCSSEFPAERMVPPTEVRASYLIQTVKMLPQRSGFHTSFKQSGCFLTYILILNGLPPRLFYIFCQADNQSPKQHENTNAWNMKKIKGKI